MTVTQIDLDDDALAQAMRLSGAKEQEGNGEPCVARVRGSTSAHRGA